VYLLAALRSQDNLINQKMMVMLLRKLGYEILVAAHGREALEILAREADKGREVECILMDASMDVMDGMECTRVIRAQQLPHRVRPFIIAQTANVTEEYRRACLDAGMDLFTVKPVHVEELVACLKKAHAHAQLALMAQHAGGGGSTAASTPVTSVTAGGGNTTGIAPPLTSPPVDPTETPPGGASTTVAGTATAGATTSTPAAPSALSPPSPLVPTARLALTPGL
jgi:CheY-like chemotaxis protein